MAFETAAHGPIAAGDLYSLEEYHRIRPEFRERVLAHKKHRQVAVGPNATLYFEDRLTMQYQVQEMLRIERIFETEAIEDELSAYNPLIPTGSNLKATFMIEFPDVDERRQRLARLKGIEDHLHAQVGNGERIACIADEDLERTSEDKTSAVHFVRFEFDAASIDALKEGAPLAFLIDHPEYRHRSDLSAEQRAALIADFD
ncbi:MAG TPA: DUF3501 family protein [Gammaproteobacteria bacterium]|nr:DUF3501 family protein [Gammaproteobacteria bacterium]